MPSQGRVNILLVDDQPAKLLSYEAILRGLGEQLIKAGSAKEALEKLLSTEIAVVLMDVCMPDLDGFELAKMIRQHPRFQKTAIIFVSAVQLTDLDQRRGYECGAVDYVAVPVVPEILRARVSVFVDLYRKTRELEKLNEELEQRVAERTSELEAYSERLRVTDQRKDEFLAMLSHELRNPLAPVLTALAIIRTRTGLDDLTLRQFSVIERQTTHMARLLDDLLDMSRITHGRIELRREVTQLQSILSAALEATLPAIQAAELSLEVKSPPEALLVDVDATRLHQVLFNLIGNAVKYTPRGGELLIAAQSVGDSVEIRFRDSGIGIAPDTLPHVFDLFVQSERALDRSQGGLGIGLAMARSLIEMHGGTIAAFSNGIGHGSEFVVTLPLAATTAPEPATITLPAEPDQESGSRRRILVVDDNVDLAESVAELLTLWGQEARVAHCGKDALRECEAFHPHVVLLDVGLPDISGYEVARTLRLGQNGAPAPAEGAPKFPVPLLIAMTGYGRSSDRDSALEAGCDHHVTKPCDPETLRQLVELAAS